MNSRVACMCRQANLSPHFLSHENADTECKDRWQFSCSSSSCFEMYCRISHVLSFLTGNQLQCSLLFVCVCRESCLEWVMRCVVVFFRKALSQEKRDNLLQRWGEGWWWSHFWETAETLGNSFLDFDLFGEKRILSFPCISSCFLRIVFLFASHQVMSSCLLSKKAIPVVSVPFSSISPFSYNHLWSLSPEDNVVFLLQDVVCLLLLEDRPRINHASEESEEEGCSFLRRYPDETAREQEWDTHGGCQSWLYSFLCVFTVFFSMVVPLSGGWYHFRSIFFPAIKVYSSEVIPAFLSIITSLFWSSFGLFPIVCLFQESVSLSLSLSCHPFFRRS